MTTLIEFADLVSIKLGFRPTVTFEQAITVMQVGEGSQARFNPIDTIYPMPGAVPFNSFGPGRQYHVWSYPDLTSGVTATARTFEGWPVVIAALRNGSSLSVVIAAVNESDGDQSGYYSQFIEPVVSTWPAAGHRLVVGTLPPPAERKGKAMVVLLAGSKGPYYWADPFGKQIMSEEDLHRAEVGGFLPATEWSQTQLDAFPDV